MDRQLKLPEISPAGPKTSEGIRLMAVERVHEAEPTAKGLPVSQRSVGARNPRQRSGVWLTDAGERGSCPRCG